MPIGKFERRPAHYIQDTVHDAALLMAQHYIDVRDENPMQDKFDEIFKKHLKAMAGLGAVGRDGYVRRAMVSDRPVARA